MTRGSLFVLLALALLAAACSSDLAVSVDAADEPTGTTDGTDTDGTDTGDTDDGTDGTDDDAEDPPDEADDPTPDPTAVPTEAPEPTATPEPEADDPEIVAQSVFQDIDDLPDDFYECAIGEFIEKPELLEIASDQDFEQLDPDSQAAVLDLAVTCLDGQTFAELFAAGMAEGAADEGFELSPASISCFTEAFSEGADRRALIELGLSEQAELSPETRAVFVDALVDCMPAELIVDIIVAEALDDPIFADSAEEVFNAACLDTLFSDETFLRPFWDAALSSSFDDDDLAGDDLSAILPLLDCLDFAVILQAQAAADGVELSDESAACVNDAIREIQLFARIIAGEELDDAELGLVIIECLTFEELSALGGN